MNNPIEIPVRAFPVRIMDERTGAETTDTIVLIKPQLQAAQIVGESSRELIYRIFNRQGYRVADIGTPIKRTICVDFYQAGEEIVAEGSTRTDQEAVC